MMEIGWFKQQDGKVSWGRKGAQNSLDQTSSFIFDIPRMRLRSVHDGIFSIFSRREENGRYFQALIYQVLQDER